MELYTAGGWLVDGDGPMPVFTAGRLRWYTGTVHTMNIITESTLESLLERAALWPLGGVEFSTGRFGSMENSEFVEAYSQVGWECVNECNWGRTWERTWERTVKQTGSVQSSAIRSVL